MSSTLPQSTYNTLIQHSIDLLQLYRHAASSCEPGLKMVLDENAQTLETMIADLPACPRTAMSRGFVNCRTGKAAFCTPLKASSLSCRPNRRWPCVDSFLDSTAFIWIWIIWPVRRRDAAYFYSATSAR
jgi:hypothetical protein